MAQRGSPPSYPRRLTLRVDVAAGFDAEIGGSYGLVSYDWSNAKQLWANTKPMDAEKRMITQASMTKQLLKQSPLQRDFRRFL